MKSDGTIAKAVQPTAASQLNLGSADHEAANEEVIRVHNWREFGNNRSDDFSTLEAANSDRAFTLSDGTTTLVGDNVRTFNDILLRHNDDGNFDIVFTFVGTGLDVSYEDSATTGGHDFQVDIDGINTGAMNATGTTVVRNESIVSGLPYGTHTAKFRRVTAAIVRGFKDFTIYGPKKPALPDGAIEIANYNIMADFVANTTPGDGTISTGTIRKDFSRIKMQKKQ